jgi:uncharacterized protein YdaU (DUF1376 family)
MSLPWMPLYIPDYLADTAHLRADEHGAYLLLIMHYWMNGGLPDDERQLARIVRMNAREWRRVRPVVAPFFYDGWRHARIEDELQRVRRTREARAAAGRSGGLAAGRRLRRARPETLPETPVHQECPHESDNHNRSDPEPSCRSQPDDARSVEGRSDEACSVEGRSVRRSSVRGRSVQDAARALADRAGAARPEPAGDA